MTYKLLRGVITLKTRRYLQYRVFGDFTIDGSFIRCVPLSVEENILKNEKSKKRVWKKVPYKEWGFFNIIPEHCIEDILVMGNGEKNE